MLTLRDAGLSKENIRYLMRGQVAPWRPSKSSIRGATRRARSLLDDERAQRIYQRYMDEVRATR